MVYFYMYAHPSYVFLHGKMQKRTFIAVDSNRSLP